jgi:ASC-1-like (ASCH) protein
VAIIDIDNIKLGDEVRTHGDNQWSKVISIEYYHGFNEILRVFTIQNNLTQQQFPYGLRINSKAISGHRKKRPKKKRRGFEWL